MSTAKELVGQHTVLHTETQGFLIRLLPMLSNPGASQLGIDTPKPTAPITETPKTGDHEALPAAYSGDERS